MKVVIVYESRTGTTAEAAALIAAAFQTKGHEASIFRAGSVDLHTLSEADLAVVGTWVDGAILFGQRPGSAGRLAAGLPDLWDKPTYTYVTYAINPGNVLVKLNKMVAAKGADIRGALELHRRHLITDAPDFVDGILAAEPALASR